MGREIRRVIPNWEHPTKKFERLQWGRLIMREEYSPMHDESVEEAWATWQEGYKEWIDGKYAETLSRYPDEVEADSPYRAFCDWDGMPPDPDYYRPAWKESEMTWLQVYETVSEGTPVTPPFEKPSELVDYLVANGDFWDQARAKEAGRSAQGWDRANAEAFASSGWAPTIIRVDDVVKEGHQMTGAMSDLSETQP